MRIDIITALPELLASPLSHSILHRAQQKGVCQIEVHNLRDYAVKKNRQIDDYAYGFHAGMVLMIEPIDRCISALKKQRKYDEVIYMTPDACILSQQMANTLSLAHHLIILCGHYKGIDERVRLHLITREISIGEYVLSGGELAALVLVDSIVRLLPQVLSDETSALSDSFQDNLLAPPLFTRPKNYKGTQVPDVLLSGNEAKIEEWEFEQSLKRTQKHAPHLLKKGDA